jgi:uncharacterized glyoxalase superfamily protein PhnB
MSETSNRPVIYPAIRYADARAAIAFLERAFGFRLHAIYEGPDGTVAHAELELDGAFVMLGSQKQDFVGTRTPAEVGGVTSTLYLYVPDVDTAHARASAAGADIVMPLRKMDYGAREFMARDPEGHVWSFGDYRPAPEPQAKAQSV